MLQAAAPRKIASGMGKQMGVAAQGAGEERRQEAALGSGSMWILDWERRRLVWGQTRQSSGGEMCLGTDFPEKKIRWGLSPNRCP